MIAPAMNTRSEDALPYRELARQRARISRTIGLDSMPRLRAAAAFENAPDVTFEVTLAFRLDSAGQVKVAGEASGSIKLDCLGCAETLAHPLHLAFECFVADSESRAGELAQTADVVLAQGVEITVAEVVEDELLLNLPERLCTAMPCERRPVLDYPLPGPLAGEQPEHAQQAAVAQDNPFAVLADLNLKKN